MDVRVSIALALGILALFLTTIVWLMRDVIGLHNSED